MGLTIPRVPIREDSFPIAQHVLLSDPEPLVGLCTALCWATGTSSTSWDVPAPCRMAPCSAGIEDVTPGREGDEGLRVPPWAQGCTTLGLSSPWKLTILLQCASVLRSSPTAVQTLQVCVTGH